VTDFSGYLRENNVRSHRTRSVPVCRKTQQSNGTHHIWCVL